MTQPVRPLRLWLSAFLLAWAADFLFYAHQPGLSYLIWISLCLIALFVTAALEGIRPSPLSWAAAVGSLAFSTTSLLRSEPFTRGIDGLIAFCGLILLTTTFRNGNWSHYRLGDYFLSTMKLLAAALIRAGGLFPKKAIPATDQPAARGSTWQITRQHSLPVLRGLLLALPVVAVLAAILASADPIFARGIEKLFSIFKFDNLPEYLFRLFYILVLGYCFTGVLLHALYPQPEEPRPNPEEPWKMRFLGSIETTIIQASVTILFTIFVAIQFRYLFGGQSNITETGYTYADYARRGFFELVSVAVLTLMLYIGLSTVTRRELPTQQRTFSLLSVALFVLVLVILVSALQRMMLYESVYGFTRLRIYTHIFIPWLGILLLIAMLLEIIHHPGRLALAFLGVTLAFSATLTLVNVDQWIVQLDVQRAQAGAELDAQHLVSLSSDAVPALVRAYLNPALSADLHKQLGPVLTCKLSKTPYQPDWRSYNLSEARADRLLRQPTLDLSSYPLDSSRYQETVVVNGDKIFCNTPYYD